MARPPSIDEDRLIALLACVFRDVGYEGASLARLSEATGLQRASLYHRFPGGKLQMAEEVLAAANAWLGDHVLAPLKGEGSPAERLAAVAAQVEAFYGGGKQACLLNMLSSSRQDDGPFSPAIKATFEGLIEAFAKLARDAGSKPKGALRRAYEAVMMMQGSLVLSRGLGSTAPFRTFLSSLPETLLATR